MFDTDFSFSFVFWEGRGIYREIIILRESLGCMAFGPFWTYGLWTILEIVGQTKDLQFVLGVYFTLRQHKSFVGPPSGSWFGD